MIIGITYSFLGLSKKLGFIWIKGLRLNVAIGFLVVLAAEVLLDFDHGINHFL
jgi:hypothetical protein